MKIIFAKYDTDVEQEIKDADMLALGMQTEMVNVKNINCVSTDRFKSGNYPFSDIATGFTVLSSLDRVSYKYVIKENRWVLDTKYIDNLIGLIDYVDQHFGNGLTIFRCEQNKGYFKCQW